MIFKKFKVFTEKQSGRSINFLKSDREKEYTSNEFDKFCEEERRCGKAAHCWLYTSAKWCIERNNQTVMELSESILFKKGRPTKY